MTITVQQLPAYEVAYVRHTGSYTQTGRAWQRLGAWAAQNGLTPANQYFIGISLDNPAEVEESALRYDACVTLPEGFAQEKHPDMEFRTLDGGLYALYKYYGSVEEFGSAFQYMYGEWLPTSEYEADAKPCLEVTMNDPATDPEGKLKVDLYVPVKKRV